MGDYNNSELQKGLLLAVLNYLELADTDLVFRDIFFAIINSSTTTCGDKITYSLLELGIQYLLAKISLDNTNELAALLRDGVWKMNLLKEIAQQKVDILSTERGGPFEEAVEVYLAYPIQLKKDLNLPIDVETMLYFVCSEVTKEDLEEAKNKVLNETNNKNAFYAFLLTQEKWEAALQHKFPEEVKVIEKYRDDSMEEDDVDYVKVKAEYEERMLVLTEKALDESSAEET